MDSKAYSPFGGGEMPSNDGYPTPTYVPYKECMTPNSIADTPSGSACVDNSPAGFYVSHAELCSLRSSVTELQERVDRGERANDLLRKELTGLERLASAREKQIEELKEELRAQAMRTAASEALGQQLSAASTVARPRKGSE